MIIKPSDTIDGEEGRKNIRWEELTAVPQEAKMRDAQGFFSHSPLLGRNRASH